MLLLDVLMPAFVEFLSVTGISFMLVFLAEFGDKSQLVCMTLATKHRPWPVLLGAMLAFSLLNLLAVLFGAVVAAWIPTFWLAIGVAALFAFFGVQSLLFTEEDEEDDKMLKSSHGVFITALMMIFMAEFGDKTQLAVAGLASTSYLLWVWLGSTLALLITTSAGIVAGQQLMKHLSLTLLHRCSGVLFLGMASTVLYQAFA